MATNSILKALVSRRPAAGIAIARPGKATTTGTIWKWNKGNLRVSLVYSPAARDVREVLLDLPGNSTVMQAIRASELPDLLALLDQTVVRIGVWGQAATLDQILHDQDRVEFYRVLSVDPKLARRKRFVGQGARSAGLFIKKRPGAKAGY
jgi:putative ubiquitin-RnfH superfamily antitoxin RatB of RatAB toxin-antitoxin module